MMEAGSERARSRATRGAFAALASALVLALAACGEDTPAKDQASPGDPPSDESSPRRKADTPKKLISCLKEQKVRAKQPSKSTSGDVALSRGLKIEHETVVIGPDTDVVAYFVPSKKDVRRAKKALGLNDTVASSGKVIVTYLKPENRTQFRKSIEACL